MERYRFYSDGTLYFVTFSVVDWLPVFVSEKAFKKLQNISSYTKIKKGDTIARAGEKATNIHLLVAGVMRAYYYDEAGEQDNKKLFVANSFVGGLTS